MPFLHPTSPVRIQNWNKNTGGLLWLISKNILSQKRLLRSGNRKFWGLPKRLLPAPSDGGRTQHQMCSRLLHLLVLRLSQHAETSPRGPQIETFVNGFQNLDFCLFLFWKCWRLKCNYFPGDNENLLFSNQQKNWWWWIHFSWSLTTEALKGALVTLSRPLAAGLRISFNPRVTCVSPAFLDFCIKIFLLDWCLRPYHLEYTSSRPITEVKQDWAMLVLGWVTAWEYMVL